MAPFHGRPGPPSRGAVPSTQTPISSAAQGQSAGAWRPVERCGLAPALRTRRRVAAAPAGWGMAWTSTGRIGWSPSPSAGEFWPRSLLRSAHPLRPAGSNIHGMRVGDSLGRCAAVHVDTCTRWENSCLVRTCMCIRVYFHGWMPASPDPESCPLRTGDLVTPGSGAPASARQRATGRVLRRRRRHPARPASSPPRRALGPFPRAPPVGGGRCPGARGSAAALPACRGGIRSPSTMPSR